MSTENTPSPPTPSWALEMAINISRGYPEGPNPEDIADALARVRRDALEEAASLAECQVFELKHANGAKTTWKIGEGMAGLIRAEEILK